VPGLAGIAEMPYPTFLLYNVLGGAVWSAAMATIGYLAGTGFRRVEHILGRASLILAGIVVTVLLVVWAARWVARNPERVRAWWARQRARPVVRQIAGVTSFLVARFRPGQAFGLGLTIGAITAIAIGTAFGTILHDVASRQDIFHVDVPILNIMIRHTQSTFTISMKIVSLLGSPFVVAIASVAIASLLAVRRVWGASVLIAATSLGALGLEWLVRILVRRPRPPVVPLAHANGWSFPSAHATLAVAFYGALAVLVARSMRRWPLTVTSWTGALMIAALVGLARTYLRVEYTTDVLGGMALGAVWLLVVGTAETAWQRRSRAADRDAAS
jgi:undecaprenyl-diphosphatase